MARRIGFFRKTKSSNRKLIILFEKLQKIKLESTDVDWKNKKFANKLTTLEKAARKDILKMLKDRKLKTADDFLRAADIFHHGPNFKSYSLAVALAAISSHLGEPWGRNHYAVALDRLLLSLGLPQHFGSQYIKKNGRYRLEKIDPKTTDKERLEYSIEPLSLLRKRARELDKVRVWTSSSKDE